MVHYMLAGINENTSDLIAFVINLSGGVHFGNQIKCSYYTIT